MVYNHTVGKRNSWNLKMNSLNEKIQWRNEETQMVEEYEVDNYLMKYYGPRKERVTR